MIRMNDDPRFEVIRSEPYGGVSSLPMAELIPWCIIRPAILHRRTINVPVTLPDLQAMAIAELEPLGIDKRTQGYLEESGRIYVGDLLPWDEVMLTRLNAIAGFGPAGIERVGRAMAMLRAAMLERRDRGGPAVLEFGESVDEFAKG